MHVWEFSGTRQLTTACTKIENIFLGSKHVGTQDSVVGSVSVQVTTAVVVIVVDLSRPETVFESGQYWMDIVQKRLEATYSKLRSRGSKLPEQLVARGRRTFFSKHPDKNTVHHSGILLVMAGMKYDQLKEPEKKKAFAALSSQLTPWMCEGCDARVALSGTHQRRPSRMRQWK